MLVVGFLIHRFEHSRLGRAASAVFVDKDLATSFGVDIKKLGRLLQVFSSTVAGGCGVIYGFLYRSFHLDFFTFHLVGLFMTIIFVGGYATMWGVVVAAPLLYGLTLLFPPEVASWRIVIYGAILVAVLVLKPEGFITRRLILNRGTTSFVKTKENLNSKESHMRKKWFVVLAVLLVLVAFVFTGCQQEGATKG